MGSFVGRHSELELLLSSVDRARGGHGVTVLLEGDAGLGKTRLLDEVVRRSGDRVRVMRAAAEELDVDRAFGVAAEAVGIRRDSPDPLRAEAAATLYSKGSDADSDLRFRVVEELCDVVEQDSLDETVLLIAEDLHWADPSSVLMLHRLSKRMAERRVAIIGSFRPTPRSDPMDRFVRSHLDAGGIAVRLTPLPLADSEELMAEMLGARPGPTLIAQVQRASGNPFYILELLSALSEEGRITVVEDVAETDASGMPGSIVQTILRRLQTLDIATLEMMRFGAATGESFALDTLATITGRSTMECFSALQEAVAAGFLIAAGPRIDFRHDLVREAIYLDIPAALRTAMHIEIARAFAASAGSAARVAHHFYLGAVERDDEAIRWMRRAASEAASRDPASAVRFLERCLELLPTDDPQRVDVMAEMLRPLFFLGDGDRANSVADALLRQTDRWDVIVMVRSALYGLHVMSGRIGQAKAEIEKGLSLPDLPDHQRAHLVGLLAASMGLMSPAEAQTMADEAIELGTAHEIPYAVASGLAVHISLASARGQLRKAVDLHARALAAVQDDPPIDAIRTGTPTLDRANVRLFGGYSLIAVDQLDAAEVSFREARESYERLGAVVVLAFSHQAMAHLLFLKGRWDDAVAEVDAARLLADRDPLAPALFPDPRTLINVHRGDLSAMSEVDDLANVPPHLTWVSSWRVASAAAARAGSGDPGGAAELLLQHISSTKKLGFEPDYRAFAHQLIRFQYESGSAAESKSLVEDIQAAATLSGDVPSYKAVALMATGMIDRSSTLLREARDVAATTAQPLLHATCAEELARRLALDGASEKAVKAAHEALDIFASLGAQRDEARMRSLLRELGVRSGARGPRMRPRTGWDSLTPAEVQVVDLLTEGLSNPQIGERLFISRRTVATHLSSVFRKLGISSRTELAAMAARKLDS